jgi:hypothetical protein
MSDFIQVCINKTATIQKQYTGNANGTQEIVHTNLKDTIHFMQSNGCISQNASLSATQSVLATCPIS